MPSVGSGLRRLGSCEVTFATLGALLLFLVAAVVSYCSLAGRSAGGGGFLGAPLGSADTPLFLAIAARNAFAALGLFSGVVTFGVGSVVGVIFQGCIVGASTAAASTEVGLPSAAGSVIGYAIFELPALVLAASAGLVPLATVLLAPVEAAGLSASVRYLRSLRPSLALLSISLVLIVIGASVETILITSRSAP